MLADRTWVADWLIIGKNRDHILRVEHGVLCCDKACDDARNVR